MFEDLNEKLVRIKNDLKNKKKWKRQQREYQKELQEVEEKISDLRKTLAIEEDDVSKLEGFSVTNLFFTILGKKEERLDKEKRELVAARLKLDEAIKSQKEIENLIQELKTKIFALDDIEDEYNSVLVTKENLIKSNSTPHSEQLFHLSDQIGNLKTYLIEVKEAIKAGNEVVDDLNSAINSLESASSWGTLDLFGGGMVTDMVKHNHIDNSTGYIHEAQNKMRKFQKELLDINEEATMQADISGLLKFADFFLDGLIADWTVQGKINNSLESTRKQRYDIERLITKLQTTAKLKQSELSSLEEQRKNLIESI